MAKQPLLLMILDGWGIAPAGQYNAAALAKTPNLDALFDKYPHTRLSSSGAAVGLPDGQMGNSEVGHLNIGAGRIVYQELTRITKAIKDGDFFENTVLSKAMQTVKANGSALHLLGLVSDGGVHSHISHLFALLEMAKRQGLNKVYVHAFLDGRDVGPQTADVYLAELDAETKRIGVGKIATVAGRYYAMDRDKRWERVQKAYDAMVLHDGTVCTDAVSGVRASYAGGVTDEFVVPFIAAPEADSCVKAGDGMIFFNFRPDRARQLTRAFVDEEFPYFARPQTARPVNFVCMTQYDETIKAPVAFAPETLEDTLTIQEIAQELGISYSSFRKLFKEHTGFAPALYQQNLKLQRAKELLSTTDESIKGIAYRLNFESPDYFSAKFKNQTGMKPSDFRNMTR